MVNHIFASADAFADIPSTGLLAPPDATPLTGDISTWTKELFATPDGASSVGFWEAGPGRSRWEFDGYAEAILIIEGELTVLADGAEPVRLAPGDVALFRAGWQGEWDAPAGLKKFYAVFPDTTQI